MTHRGLDQRNAALDYIRDNKIEGVVYFCDDDNAYELRLFAHLRSVTKLSLFAVGGISRYGYEGPTVDENGVVSGWISSFRGSRKYPVGMCHHQSSVFHLTIQTENRFLKNRHGCIRVPILIFNLKSIPEIQLDNAERTHGD